MKEPVLFVAGFLLGVSLIAFFGYNTPAAWELVRREAVQQHHAEYYLDDKHERQWRWLPVNEEAQP